MSEWEKVCVEVVYMLVVGDDRNEFMPIVLHPRELCFCAAYIRCYVRVSCCEEDCRVLVYSSEIGVNVLFCNVWLND